MPPPGHSPDEVFDRGNRCKPARQNLRNKATSENQRIPLYSESPHPNLYCTKIAGLKTIVVTTYFNIWRPCFWAKNEVLEKILHISPCLQ